MKLIAAVGVGFLTSAAILPCNVAGSSVVTTMVGCHGVKVSVPLGMTADVTVAGCKVTKIVTSVRATPDSVCAEQTYSADIALGYDVFGFLTAAEATDFNHYYYICGSEIITDGWSNGGCYANSGAAARIDQCWNDWIGGRFSPPSYIVSAQYADVTNFDPLGFVGNSQTGQMHVNFAVDAYQHWTLNAYCYATSNPGGGWIGFTDMHCQIH